MKYVTAFAKRLIFSFFILYGYNIIASNFNLIIPINIVTLFLVMIFGFPALLFLILLFILVY